jgi:hypothetical protein
MKPKRKKSKKIEDLIKRVSLLPKEAQELVLDRFKQIERKYGLEPKLTK